ncbi:hypothetical protein GVanDAA622_09310 [Enterococcus faecium]|nr:hypothetical protein GVanDAA622_09310 [Enterococcus faecium]
MKVPKQIPITGSFVQEKTVSIPSFIITTTKVVLEMFETFLKEFTGYLHCDGYSGYNAVESVRLVYCFAHVRRKFFEAIPKGKKNTDIPAAQAVKQLDKWFVLEKKWKDFSPEKRLSCRQQELRPLFIAFYEWMATIDPVAKSKLDAAVQYACKLRSGFEPILKMVV